MLQKSWYSKCVVAVVLFLSLSAFGQRGWANEIHLSSFPIPLMVDDKNSGVFVDLVREIETRIPYTIKLSILPARRTLVFFHSNRVDGFFPALDVMVNKPVNRSDHIYLKQDFAFVRKGYPLPKTLAELRGMKVGLTQGYAYSDDLINISANYLYANNDVSNMRKLEFGRLDVFLAEEKSGLKALKLSGAKDIAYDPQSPLSQQKVFFAFQNTLKGSKYAQVFSQALADMKMDGSFERIMAQAN